MSNWIILIELRSLIYTEIHFNRSVIAQNSSHSFSHLFIVALDMSHVCLLSTRNC